MNWAWKQRYDSVVPDGFRQRLRELDGALYRWFVGLVDGALGG